MENHADSVQADVTDLVERIRRREVALFCGAGISRNSGLPIVHDIESYVLERLDASAEEIALVLATALPFEGFMEALDHARSVSGLLDVFAGGEPNANHRLIAGLAKAGLVSTIYTTNFDRLIEHALEAAGLRENHDFARHTNRDDFDGLDWSRDAIRVVKLHGSIEDRDNIAVTLRRVAGKVWTQGTRSAIEQLFSTGKHATVLILGYSSSDRFDLSPQIESLAPAQKHVLLVEHEQGTPSVEDLAARAVSNPFRRFTNGRRLCADTDWLVRTIREQCLPPPATDPRELEQPDWRRIVDEWAPNLGDPAGKADAEYLLGTILMQVSRFAGARAHFERGLGLAAEAELEGRSHIGVALASEQLADYDAAISHAEAAMRIGTERADTKMVLTAKEALGAIHLDRAEYEQAERCFLEATPDKDAALADPQAAVSTINNLGAVRAKLARFAEAIEAFERCATICAAIGDKQAEGQAITNIGNVHTARGDNRAALRAHETALGIFRSIGDRNGEVAALDHVGIAHKNLGDYEKASECYAASLKLAEEIGNARGLMFAHASLALAAQNRGDTRAALAHADQALVLAERVDDKTAKITILVNLGAVYTGLGQAARASDCFARGLEIADRIGDVTAVTYLLIGKANLFGQGGDLPRAYEMYVEALERAEKAGLKKCAALALQNIGSTLSDLGQLQEAFEATSGALDLAGQIGDGATEARALNVLGLIHKRTGNFPAAIELYEKGLQLARRLGDRGIERVCLGNLAIAYGKVGRTVDLLACAQQALVIARELGDPIGEGRQLCTLGNAYASMQDPERARRSYEEGLALFRTAGARREEAMALDSIASTLANQGKFREALPLFEQAKAVAVTNYTPGETFLVALNQKIAAMHQALG